MKIHNYIRKTIFMAAAFTAPSLVYGGVTIIAKDAQSLSGSAALVESKKYLTFTEENDGSATYNINLPKAGLYKVRASVIARKAHENSVYFSIDSGAKQLFNFDISTTPKLNEFPTAINLTAGSHKLTLSGAEPYIKLASIELVEADGSTTPVPAPTATPAPKPSPTATPKPTATPAPTPKPSATPAPPPDSSTGLNPKAAPAANFDLSLWKITLPIDSSGGNSGTATEVKNIPSTYQKSPYFFTGSDGGMVFSAPTDGATTSGSKYPRSELREMTSSGGNAAWTVAQGGTLSATLAVNEMPKASTGSARIVVGQIHGPDDELCRLYYDNGALYFVDDKAGSDHKETKFTLKSSSGATTNIPLNSKFSYTIKATSSTMSVTAEHNGVTYSASEPISSFWPGKALYFKAGLYLQVAEPGSGAGNTGSGSGKVSFYKLSKPSHP